MQEPPPVQRPVPPPVPPPPPPPPVEVAPEPLPPPKVAQEPTTTRVALLAPLSGAHAELGRSLMNAAQLAVFDIAPQWFSLLPLDTAGDPATARTAALTAVNKGAALILGPLLSDSVKAVAPIAKGSGVPVVAFSNNRAVAQPGINIIGFTPETEVDRVVSFAIEQGLRRIAVFAPSTPYGRAALGALRQAVSRGGGTLVRVESYPAETKDFAGIVARVAPAPPPAASVVAGVPGAPPPASPPLGAAPQAVPSVASLGFDAVMIADGGERLKALATALAESGIGTGTVRLLGTGLWDDPSLSGVPALIGGWYAGISPINREGFERQYLGVYGQKPPRLATLAYDATAMAAAIAGDGKPGVFPAEMLMDPNGFLGRDGLFRLRPDGVVERALAVLEITRGDPTTISPAPSAFKDGS